MKKILIHWAALFICFNCFAQKQSNNALLWRIENKENDNVSYLFGTIHLAQKRFVVYSDSVYEAIQKSNRFYNEVDLLNQSFFGDNELLDFFEAKVNYMDSLKTTAGWKSLINRINQRYNAAIDPGDLEAFVAFGQKIMTEYFEPEQDVDVSDIMLAQFAKSLGKKTGGLETHLLQFKMLYDIIDARVGDTTLELTDEAQVIVNMKEHYLKENIDSMTRIVENINPTYRKIVFDDRNKTMSDSIAKHIMNESSFFAIGAGHLGGKQGVINLLREKGLIITPVHSENKMSLLVIKKIFDQYKYKDVEGVKDLDTKIVIEEAPPPPPPKENPPKVKMQTVPKAKTKGKQ